MVWLHVFTNKNYVEFYYIVCIYYFHKIPLSESLIYDRYSMVFYQSVFCNLSLLNRNQQSVLKLKVIGEISIWDKKSTCVFVFKYLTFYSIQTKQSWMLLHKIQILITTTVANQSRQLILFTHFFLFLEFHL